AEGFFITADRDENGSIKRVIWGIKSITEQKQMELEYQRELEIKAEEARNANEAKSKFLFNMSHDIRTPMNAIIGYSQLIKRELTDPKLLDYEEKIEHSSNLLMSIINNVLDMARIESGKAEVDLQYVYAGNVTDEIMSIFQAEAREKGIELILTKNVTHHHLLLDETKVKEVLLNLLSNAVKYTPEGGRIDFSITELPSNRDGYALFQTVVKDTGIGMSKEYLPQLFDSFTRERNTTTSKVSGTGLGMPIVKKLVDLMGGTIEVESELGKGTTFTLTLEHRLADEAYYDQKAVTSDAEKKEIMQDKKILLAEDNDLNAEIAMIILEERGFVIDRANDGIECVAMMEGMPAGTYDIILMDIQMPNMDGYKATKSIRQLSDSDKANIPIIAMTANAFEEDKMNAINAGMNGHIAKPIDVNKLEDVILSVLEGKED
ncbi:MAG: ATP-binding protein, partial [Eubacteriales bacterium]|nr:ATP-binding protein [Eubacteriales bacterium]